MSPAASRPRGLTHSQIIFMLRGMSAPTHEPADLGLRAEWPELWRCWRGAVLMAACALVAVVALGVVVLTTTTG
jgi:hypothetical protein